MDMARTEHLRERGVLQGVEAQGLYLAVTDVRIRYVSRRATTI